MNQSSAQVYYSTLEKDEHILAGVNESIESVIQITLNNDVSMLNFSTNYVLICEGKRYPCIYFLIFAAFKKAIKNKKNSYFPFRLFVF